MPTPPVPAPFQVNIELTTACNYSCRHCAVSSPAYTPRTMSRQRAFGLVAELSRFDPHPSHLSVSGHGESTVLPWFGDLLRHARSSLPEVAIGFQTNGSMLADLAPALVATRVDVVCVSVDGAQDTFDMVRGPGSFARLIEGLRAVAEEKARVGSARPLMQFAVTLMTVNVHDLETIVDVAALFGVTTVTTQPLTPYESLGTSAWALRTLPDAEHQVVIEAIDHARSYAAFRGIEFRVQNGEPFNEPAAEWHVAIGPNTRQPPPDSPPFFRDCRDPWLTAFVNASGGLNTCCFRHDDARENIDTQSLVDIWYSSPGLNGVRDRLQSGALDEVCRMCPTRPASQQPPVIPRVWTLREVG